MLAEPVESARLTGPPDSGKLSWDPLSDERDREVRVVVSFSAGKRMQSECILEMGSDFTSACRDLQSGPRYVSEKNCTGSPVTCFLP